MEMCLQKDNIISKLQAAMDAIVDDATRDVNPVFYWRLLVGGRSKFFHSVPCLMFSQRALVESTSNPEEDGRTLKRGAAKDNEDEEPAKKRGERMGGAEEGN